MKDKKGVELGLNTIIIAIIVLLVLVILVYLIITEFALFKQGTNCATYQGICKESSTCESPVDGYKEDGTIIPAADLCSNPAQVCCSPI